MTIYQFNKLDEMEQAEVLWDKGVHIGERYDGEHDILLYQIDGFYLEAFYHREYNELRRFRTFEGTELLAPYIGKIDISQLG